MSAGQGKRAKPINKVLPRLEGVRKSGVGQWVARCPAHCDKTPSLSIGENQKGEVGLTCHAGCTAQAVCDSIGLEMSDLFPTTRARKGAKAPAPKRQLVMAVKGLSDAEIAEAKQAAKKLGPSVFSGYKLRNVYAYRKANGVVWCWRARFDHATESKRILPFHFANEWLAKEPTAPRAGKPLYRLPEVLASDGPVFVVEGEKCADALAALGIAATTSGGSKTAGKADWSPLAGRQCVVWPDNDDPGDKYAADVVQRLQAFGCDVRCIDVAALDLPGEGDDAADWLAARPRAKAAAVLALATTRPAAADEGQHVQLVRASDIAPKPIDWLWEGWLACKMLHILAGDGGTGKTTLALTLAAAVSTGGKLPDGQRARRGNVLIWTGEDAVAEVLVPRLQEAGADMFRIYFVGSTGDGHERRPFDPSQDMYDLEIQAQRIGDVECRLWRQP